MKRGQEVGEVMVDLCDQDLITTEVLPILNLTCILYYENKGNVEDGRKEGSSTLYYKWLAGYMGV